MDASITTPPHTCRIYFSHRQKIYILEIYERTRNPGARKSFWNSSICPIVSSLGAFKAMTTLPTFISDPNGWNGDPGSSGQSNHQRWRDQLLGIWKSGVSIGFHFPARLPQSGDEKGEDLRCKGHNQWRQTSWDFLWGRNEIEWRKWQPKGRPWVSIAHIVRIVSTRLVCWLRTTTIASTNLLDGPNRMSVAALPNVVVRTNKQQNCKFLL